ncbi:MAG: hypothetical protein H7Y18_07105 [Clostridiaceae bacterium]|nr:hypothetical protein [Clostridiaceae bacterium]
MKNSYKEIYSILKRIRRRFILKNIIFNVIIGISVALVIGITMIIASRLIPIYKVYDKAIYITVTAIALSFLYSIIIKPNLKNIASKVDVFELKERISTSLEIEKEDSPYKELLVKDALSNLKELNYKKNIPLIPKRNRIIVLSFLIVIILATTLLPDPLKDIAEKNHNLKVYKNEQVKRVEVAVEKIKETKKLDAEQKKDLLAKLQELKTELKSAKEIKEAEKAVDKTAEKLELKKNEQLVKDVKNLEAKFGENSTTKALAEAIKKSDVKEVKKELDKLKKDSKTMDGDAKAKLKDSLTKASASTDNKTLQAQLDSLNNALASGDESAINSSVDSISASIESGMSNESMNKAVAQLQQNIQGQPQNGGGSQQAQGQGAGQGQGQGSGQGSGSGQGQGQGSGQGQGQGAGGSGAGNGSGNGDGGVTDYSGGGIANKQPSAGTEKQYEKVYTPSNLGGTNTASGLTGKKNGNSAGSESTITEDYNAELGTLIPYDQVIGQYNDKAMESLNDNEIPDGMKDVIKGYFSSLQQ